MRVDFVVPVYNEVAALGSFHGSLSKALSNSGHEFRFIYVNDAPRRRTASTKKNRPGHVAPAGEYPKVGHGVSA